jgi:hypothetical protein
LIWIKRACAVALVGLAMGGCSSSDKLLGSDGSTVSSAGGGAAGGAPSVPLPTPAALGESCVGGDEWVPYFAGYAAKEVNVEDRAPQCESSICLINHFQGRASCPYGQAKGGTDCLLPDGTGTVVTPVQPQLQARQANVASICSCRCDGDGPGPYCTCPESMQCEPLVEDLHLGVGDLAGSYCIPKGSQYGSSQPSGPVCVEPNCGPAHPI